MADGILQGLPTRFDLLLAEQIAVTVIAKPDDEAVGVGDGFDTGDIFLEILNVRPACYGAVFISVGADGVAGLFK